MGNLPNSSEVAKHLEQNKPLSGTGTCTPLFKMNVVVLTPDEALLRGLEVVGFTEQRQNRVKKKRNLARFRTHFSADPGVYAVLLTRLQTTSNDKAKLDFETLGVYKTIKYFFMAIHFLACYPKLNEGEGLFGVCEKTYRVWVWKIVGNISSLKPEIILWPASWGNPDSENNDQTIFIITVDGVHCRIEEPTHESFSENTKYYSHKFKSAALDYEIGVSIFEDKIVWVAGPYEAGKPDITIFRHKLKQKILDSREASGVNHRAIGDKGYRGEREVLSVPSSQDTPRVRYFKSRALSRHETANARLKCFECLDETFRHGEAKHQQCFDSAAVIVQLQFENGSPLFRV